MNVTDHYRDNRPRRSEVVQVTALAAPDHPSSRRPHILVVDDEPSIVAVISDVLREEGCQVTGWAAPMALSEIDRLKPDLVLLDLLFDGSLLGLEFLERMRLAPAYQSIPVVICTAVGGGTRVPILPGSSPVVRVIAKPFDIDALVAVVRGTLGARVGEMSN